MESIVKIVGFLVLIVCVSACGNESDSTTEATIKRPTTAPIESLAAPVSKETILEILRESIKTLREANSEEDVVKRLRSIWVKCGEEKALSVLVEIALFQGPVNRLAGTVAGQANAVDFLDAVSQRINGSNERFDSVVVGWALFAGASNGNDALRRAFKALDQSNKSVQAAGHCALIYTTLRPIPPDPYEVFESGNVLKVPVERWEVYRGKQWQTEMIVRLAVIDHIKINTQLRLAPREFTALEAFAGGNLIQFCGSIGHKNRFVLNTAAESEIESFMAGVKNSAGDFARLKRLFPAHYQLLF